VEGDFGGCFIARKSLRLNDFVNGEEVTVVPLPPPRPEDATNLMMMLSTERCTNLIVYIIIFMVHVVGDDGGKTDNARERIFQ
jgi:hypothetical protein